MTYTYSYTYSGDEIRGGTFKPDDIVQFYYFEYDPEGIDEPERYEGIDRFENLSYYKGVQDISGIEEIRTEDLVSWLDQQMEDKNHHSLTHMHASVDSLLKVDPNFRRQFWIFVALKGGLSELSEDYEKEFRRFRFAPRYR